MRRCTLQGESRPAIIEQLEPRQMLAAELVKDVNTQVASSGTYGEFTPVDDGSVYFIRSTPNRELWRTDLTQAGTYQVTDLMDVVMLGQVGPWMIFRAYHPDYAYELWRTDGTPEGTSLLKDIGPGTADSAPYELGTVAGRLVFAAYEPAHGRELWSTDGTPEGTVLLKDLLPGSMSGVAAISWGDGQHFPDGSVPFWGEDGVHRGIFKTDGTPEGTSLVVDTSVDAMLMMGNQAELAGWRVAIISNLDQVFVSDGTIGGTLTLADSRTDGVVDGPIESRDGEFFYMRRGGTSPGLFRIPAGSTSPVAVLESGTGAPFIQVETPVNLNGSLWFRGYRAATGWELYCIDPGQTTARFLGDLTEPGPGPTDPYYGAGKFAASGSTVYFSVRTKDYGRRLWSSDLAGLTMAPVHLNSGAGIIAGSDICPLGDRVMFWSYVMGVFRGEIWVSNATPDGTYRTWVAPGNNNSSSSPEFLGTMNNRLYFSAEGSNGDRRLHTTDGTPAGTVELTQLPGSAAIEHFTPTSFGQAFFAMAVVGNLRPWVTDGTVAGTFLLGSQNMGTDNLLSDFTEMNGKVYFFLQRGMSGRELWQSDGTLAGTVLVRDALPDSGAGVPFLEHAGPALIGNVLYYAGTDSSSSGVELWRSNGTSAGTSLLRDINPGEGSSNPMHFLAAGGKLFFSATTLTLGSELWTTDGTAEGTSLVIDLVPGAGSSDPAPLLFHKGLLYFSILSSNDQRVLYCTDGTAAGTQFLANLSVYHMVAMNDLVYFVALNGPPDPINKPGSSLWKTDGTPEGTARVQGIYADDGGYNWSPEMDRSLRSLSEVNGRLFFCGRGTLWISDGTAAGTRPASEVAPGVPSCMSTTLGVLNGGIYFGGDTGDWGVELFRLNDTFAPLPLASTYQPAGPRPTVAFRFSEAATVNSTDVVLTNLTTGQVMPANTLLVSSDAASRTTLLSPAMFWNSGRYRATLPAAKVVDLAGNAAAADSSLDFDIRVGDANGDLTIDIDDYFAIDRGYALGLNGMENGDFNNSGSIDADDYNLIDREYLLHSTAQSISSPAPLTMLVPAPNTAVLLQASPNAPALELDEDTVLY